MSPFQSIRQSARVGVLALAGALLLPFMVGCNADSFLDPAGAGLGRWEPTPGIQPILDRLSVIESDDALTLPTDQPRREDLIPDIREYVMGPGDIITVTVYELRVPGVDDIQTLRINETGMIRPAIIGPIKASGKSPSQLETAIANKLDEDGILRNATVSVILQQSRQNTYSVFGESTQGGIQVGTYVIPKPDFRLIEALTTARGIPGRTRKIYIIRQAALDPSVTGDVPEVEQGQEPQRPAPVDPGDLIEGLEGGLEGEGGNTPDDRPAPPPGVNAGIDGGNAGAQWVFIDGKWVRVNAPTGEDSDENIQELRKLITQRIIEIPYDRLKSGDMAYNIVIRPGDIISVPDPSAGFVYMMGQVNRPGAYTVPGEKELTLMRLVASAGGLSGLAWPSRVDIIRQLNENEQAIVRVDLKAIADGTEPDIYLKQNDVINVGSSGVALPLALLRNGIRFTYGFGFVLDRNFNTDVFGTN